MLNSYLIVPVRQIFRTTKQNRLEPQSDIASRISTLSWLSCRLSFIVCLYVLSFQFFGLPSSKMFTSWWRCLLFDEQSLVFFLVAKNAPSVPFFEDSTSHEVGKWVVAGLCSASLKLGYIGVITCFFNADLLPLSANGYLLSFWEMIYSFEK